MKVLSHRGYWKTVEEKNLEAAFARSFSLGYGTETDVRDLDGELVISHDMPRQGCLTLKECLSFLGGRDLPLAMNIKADGLAVALAEQMKGVKDWFVFDMAVPDMRAHFSAGNPVFTRLSEVEQQPAWLEQAQGIWLDSFGPEWYGSEAIEELLGRGKRVCVVSSELHKRPKDGLWALLKTVSNHERLMLCTDVPEEASAYFGAMAA